MKCAVCGRELKNPESIRNGYGPVCYERLFGIPVQKKGEKKGGRRQSVEDDSSYDIPGQINLEDYLSTIT